MRFLFLLALTVSIVVKLICSAPATSTFFYQYEQEMNETAPMPGSFSSIDTSDPNVKKALHYAVEQLNANWTDNAYYWKIDKIFSARSQIVTGTFYEIFFELYKTRCLKSSDQLNKCLNSDVKPANDISATPCNLLVFHYLPTDGHGINDYMVTNSTCYVFENC